MVNSSPLRGWVTKMQLLKYNTIKCRWCHLAHKQLHNQDQHHAHPCNEINHPQHCHVGWCSLVTVTSGVDLAWYRSHLEDGIRPASAFMGRPSLIVIISSASTIKPFYPHILWANKHFLPVIKRLRSSFCRCIIMELHIAPHNGQWTWNLLFTSTGTTWHLRPQDAIFVIGFVYQLWVASNVGDCLLWLIWVIWWTALTSSFIGLSAPNQQGLSTLGRD